MPQTSQEQSSEYFSHREGQQNSCERQRSRVKKRPSKMEQNQVYLRKFVKGDKKSDENQNQSQEKKFINFEQSVADYMNQKNESDQYRSVIRSLMKIEQGRQQHFEKFAKIVWIYKNRLRYDYNLYSIMVEPTRYLQQLTTKELQSMILQAEQHRRYQQQRQSLFQEYWSCLIGLLNSLIQKATLQNQELKEQYQYKVKEIINKKLPQLIKLQKQTKAILKNQSFGSNTEYWEYVLKEVQYKKMQMTIHQFYQNFKNTHQEIINQSLKQKQQQIYEQPTSPTLLPYSTVNPRLLVNEVEQNEARKKLAQRIFKEEFEKGQQRLQRNLSLPHNHGLLSSEIVTDTTGTFDQITKQIIEFQKYKRMEEDEQQFDDWVPCETEGRFRDRKPIYLNRVRVACQWNKYNTTHYNEQNPPPKTVQGYKFNIFYPDLYDKQKTPQYYLQNTDDSNYCIIKFKAGPPYKDIAFKVLKKEWDFTQKSGFESIFSKGILQLYFNFKKPKYRI